MNKIYILILGLIVFNASAQKDTIYQNLTLALQTPEKVYKLDLSNQNLSEIPIDIQKFTNLKELNISNNNISELIKLKLTNLTFLDISNNKIRKVDYLLSYKSLSELKLDNNDLETITGDIFKLKSLEKISLGNSSLANSTVIENMIYLKSIDDENALKSYSDLSALSYLSLISNTNKKLEPWEHSAHSVGYNNGLNNIVTSVTDGNSDSSLIGKKVKITLDKLYVHDYPGSGKHYVLFDFKINNSLADNSTESVHFNQTRTAQEGQLAGILSIPIFLNLNLAKEGILFECTTINVKNENDENFLEIMESNEMKQGIQLANSINPVVPILSSLAAGIAKKIASRNKNKKIQEFTMGLDFSTNKSKAKLRRGTYIVAQTGLNNFNWDEWELKGGNVISKKGNIVLPYNYLIFSIE